MIKDLIERGLIKENDKIVEASSGNTAISISWISRFLNLKPIIFIDKKVSKNKILLLKKLGAKVYVTENPREKAKEFAKNKNLIFINQYSNDANWKAHYETTGPEILKDVKSFDAFVMGIGTGGTIVGVGKFLKERMKNVKIVGIAPKDSFIFKGKGVEKIEGLASNFVSEIFLKSKSIVDKIEKVSYKQAINGLKMLIERGILGGISSGANFYVARKYARRGLKVVTIAADSIFRYDLNSL